MGERPHGKPAVLDRSQAGQPVAKKNAPMLLAPGRWQVAGKLFFLAGKAGLLQGVKHGLVVEIAGHFK